MGGEVDAQVEFLSRGRGYALFLTSTEAVLVLREGGSARNVAGGPPAAKRERGKALRGNVLRIRFVGANPVPAVAGVGELPGRSSYFVGNDPKKWRANVPTYAKVEYRDVYPGVNLVYYGNQRQLEYDFVVSPAPIPRLSRWRSMAWTASPSMTWAIWSSGQTVARSACANPSCIRSSAARER